MQAGDQDSLLVLAKDGPVIVASERYVRAHHFRVTVLAMVRALLFPEGW